MRRGDTDADSHPRDNANTHPDPDTDPDTDGHPYADAHPYANSNTNPNPDARDDPDANAHANADTHPDPDSDANSHTDSHANSHTDPVPVPDTRNGATRPDGVAFWARVLITTALAARCGPPRCPALCLRQSGYPRLAPPLRVVTEELRHRRDFAARTSGRLV